MPTGLRANTAQGQGPLLSQRAWTALDGLRQRQQALPDELRRAAKAGDLEQVTRLRIEWDELPARLWAAEYTSTHRSIEEWDPNRGQRDRHGLEMQAARLAQELHR